MLTVTVIITLIGASTAIPLFGFTVDEFVGCTNGQDLATNIQECADTVQLDLPNMPDSFEKELANLCRLAPPSDGQDPKTVAMGTCVRSRCFPVGFLNFALSFLPCDIMLSQVLIGCTFETLSERITTCLPAANVGPSIADAGVAALLEILRDPTNILERMQCALYAGLGSLDTGYDTIRACIAQKCPNFPDPDLNLACPGQVIPGQGGQGQWNPPVDSSPPIDPPFNDPPPINQPSNDPPPINPPFNDPPPINQPSNDPPPRNPPSNDPPPRNPPSNDPPPRNPPSNDPPPRDSPSRDPPPGGDP